MSVFDNVIYNDNDDANVIRIVNPFSFLLMYRIIGNLFLFLFMYRSGEKCIDPWIYRFRRQWNILFIFFDTQKIYGITSNFI